MTNFYFVGVVLYSIMIFFVIAKYSKNQVSVSTAVQYWFFLGLAMSFIWSVVIGLLTAYQLFYWLMKQARNLF